ncbi:MAG TPA: hypothetical protein VFE47_16090 [Tepidisphaeraceae bacterium]|jgi:hypothetical protein|nr:hypothetical protein [Tepidisphaeraceae bacterium]
MKYIFLLTVGLLAVGCTKKINEARAPLPPLPTPAALNGLSR